MANGASASGSLLAQGIVDVEQQSGRAVAQRVRELAWRESRVQGQEDRPHEVECVEERREGNAVGEQCRDHVPGLDPAVEQPGRQATGALCEFTVAKALVGTLDRDPVGCESGAGFDPG
jgi:hypothetical protein